MCLIVNVDERSSCRQHVWSLMFLNCCIKTLSFVKETGIRQECLAFD